MIVKVNLNVSSFQKNLGLCLIAARLEEKIMLLMFSTRNDQSSSKFATRVCSCFINTLKQQLSSKRGTEERRQRNSVASCTLGILGCISPIFQFEPIAISNWLKTQHFGGLLGSLQLLLRPGIDARLHLPEANALTTTL